MLHLRRVWLVTVSLLLVAGCGSDAAGPADALQLRLLDGEAQWGTPGRALDAPLRIAVRDASGAPAAGVRVEWTTTLGSGSVTPTTLTDGNGIAATTFTLGDGWGPQQARAAVAGASAGAVVFTANGPGNGVAAVGGIRQRGPAGTVLPTALVIEARGRDGAPLVDAPVVWTAAGGGTIAPLSERTDGQGRASAVYTLGAAPGLQRIDATVTSPAGPQGVRFDATALEGAAPALVGSFGVTPPAGPRRITVRDGLAFVSAWDAGLVILDVGAGLRGGSPSHPVEVGRIKISDVGVKGGPMAQSAWWFHSGRTGERRYVFVGQGGEESVPAFSNGDLHVVDISDPAAPVEVAALAIPGAGIRGFQVDEAAEVLYAAYKNAGVVAIDVSGTLAGDLTSRIIARNGLGSTEGTYASDVALARGSVYASDRLGGLSQLALAAAGLGTLGGGDNLPHHFSSDVVIGGGFAYTGTTGRRPFDGDTVIGNLVYTWALDADGAPTLVDSIVPPAAVIGLDDLELGDDGRLLAVTAATTPAGRENVFFYDLADGRSPRLLAGASHVRGATGVSLWRSGGRRFAFVAAAMPQAELLVYDITDLAP